MKVKMLRDKFGKLSLTVRTEWSKGNRKCTRAGALRQNLHLVAGQSEMVTEKYPNPTEETRWDLREKLGMMTQKEEEIQQSTYFMWQILSSFQVFFLLCIHQKRLCSAAGKNDPQISVTYTHIYTHTETNAHIQTHSYRDTHTHSSQPTDVCDQWGSCTCTIWNTQLLWQEKERDYRVIFGLFLPALSDTGENTHVSLARMSHWGVEIQPFDGYYCLSTSFSRTLERSAVNFFSPWRSFWGTALCRDWMWSDPLQWAWRHFLFGSFGWCVSRYSTEACAEWD